MVEAEGLQDPRDELLAELGLQFFDLDRWPECDDAVQKTAGERITELADQMIRVFGTAGVMYHRQMEEQYKRIGKTFAQFQLESDDAIKQLNQFGVQLSQPSSLQLPNTNQFRFGIEQYDYPLPCDEEKKPNLNKNGPIKNPHRRHGRG